MILEAKQQAWLVHTAAILACRWGPNLLPLGPAGGPGTPVESEHPPLGHGGYVNKMGPTLKGSHGEFWKEMHLWEQFQLP